MRNYIQIALFFFTGLLLTSCDGIGNKTIVGSGPVESMEVEVPAFDGVNVTGTCNVEIQIGEPQTVEFYAQSEILDVMDYEVDDGILEIGFKKGYSVNTSEEIRAEITIPELRFTGVTGACNYELEGAQQEELNIYISGVGNIYAFDMPVNQCLIRVSGTSTCQVHVIDHLDVVISGVGNIFYRGSPDITTDISGVGNVSPDGN